MTTAGTPAVTVFPRALNIAAEYIDRPVAEGRGSSPAIRVASAAREELTYEQLLALVNRAAGTLQAAGVEMEQRVGILLPGFHRLAVGLLRRGEARCRAGPL